jgi:formylglycine-generating enzyme required for sulfatase activity
MAGNVFEIVSFEGESHEVGFVRGGSFAFDSTAARTEYREQIEPELRDITIGLRICADVPF